ncbi:MAG: MBL fold metallo-hydrolase [Cytophagales bacterium]|tara:strand:+ start:3527 stop:4414 length:888 start_codon:yes stop_codon:yes gene_type:complete
MIKTIDLNFQGIKSTVACFLLKINKELALIECGPESCLKHLKNEIKKNGEDVRNIKHVFLTHIHLDHAGAAWWFAKNGANIYVHPFGERHLVNPEKLISSAEIIYGNNMKRLWGDIKAINENKVIPVKDKERIKINDMEIKALHTPGHAKHHISWVIGDSIFTGDVVGAKINNGPLVPACPPPDINIKEWEKSLEIIKKENPKYLYFTHFGKFSYNEREVVDLQNTLKEWLIWVKKNEDIGEPILIEKFESYINKSLKNKLIDDETIEQYYIANPPYMSILGLKRVLMKNKYDKT